MLNVSCTMIHNSSVLKSPPVDKFVKVFKTISITKCFREKKENPAHQCETRTFGATGSGMFVDVVKEYAVVLTSGHVCDSSSHINQNDPVFKYTWEEKLAVQNHKNQFFVAKVVIAEQATDKSADLCTLVIDGLKGSDDDIKIARREPRIGEDIYYIGAPMGIYHPPTALIMKGVYSGKVDKFVSLSSIPVAPGASGSAVLSLSNRIMGVIFAVHPDFAHSAVIINHSRVKNFLLRTQKILELSILQQENI